MRMQIYVRTLTGKRIPVTVKSHYTIKSVKRQIEAAANIHHSQQLLFLSGTKLKNNRTLDYYKVWKDSTLDLVLSNSRERTPLSPSSRTAHEIENAYGISFSSSVSSVFTF